MIKHTRKHRDSRMGRALSAFLATPTAPDPTRYVRPSSQIKTSDAAGAYDDSFDYNDPSSQGYLPENVDGVIQLSTPEQRATDRAYAMALKDPMSVVGERQFYTDDKWQSPTARNIIDAGHALELKRVSEHHDPERLSRVREGLGLDPDADRE